MVLASAQGDPPITVESDHVICATGYRADVQRLGFLDPGVRSGAADASPGRPCSRAGSSPPSPASTSSGLAAAVSFGPMMRFMYGDEFAARRITQDLVRCAA